MEAETAEPPLSLRRQFLSDKLLLKLISKKSEIVGKVHTLTILNYTHSYWKKKKCPLLVSSYSWITQIKQDIYSSTIPPYFQLHENTFKHLPKIVINNYGTKDPRIIKSLFRKEMATSWSNSEHIFTDGSLLNKNTGCAFFHKNKISANNLD